MLAPDIRYGLPGVKTQTSMSKGPGVVTTLSADSADVWVLRTHAPGDNGQSLALAEALDVPWAVKRIDWPMTGAKEDRALLRAFLVEGDAAEAKRATAGLVAPWPRLVICCGRRADRVGFWIKHQSGGATKVVSIGRAHRPVANYDLLAATPQFVLPDRPNVVKLPLPLAPWRGNDRNGLYVADGNIASVPKPWFTILLGGEVKQFAISPEELQRTARAAQEAANQHSGSVVVSTSRRTSAKLLATVECALHDPHIYRWSEASREENPYETLLQQSAALFVTADSASMVVECCQSGTPTYIIEYPDRLDLRHRMRRDLYRFIRQAVECCSVLGFAGAGDWLDRAQERLHARGILRYPRDLRRLHASIFGLDLARRAVDFDPARPPPRSQVANDFTELSGLSRLVMRCRALRP